MHIEPTCEATPTQPQLTSIIALVVLYVQALMSTLCALTVCRLATANMPSSQRLMHAASAGLSALSVITTCKPSNTHAHYGASTSSCVKWACNTLHFCSCCSNARPASSCWCWKQTVSNYSTLACCHLHRNTVQSGSPVSVTNSFVSPLQAQVMRVQLPAVRLQKRPGSCCLI
jgi:Tfp pilus assembly protein PilX